uniref:Uncharacterized protein n=1 Tax=Macaca fascicularis TaxID=9541 RepID=A0A7N9CGL5_MACFA
ICWHLNLAFPSLRNLMKCTIICLLHRHCSEVYVRGIQKCFGCFLIPCCC